MGTRCVVRVLVDDRKEQFYHHFDGYPSGVGWELFRTYMSLAHGFSSKGDYTRWVMERTKTCRPSSDIDDSYEKEPWDTSHGDIEYEYLLDFNKKIFQIKDIEKDKVYSLDEVVKEIAADLREEITHILEQSDETFLECARRFKLS